MKYAGKSLKGPRKEFLAIPRQGGDIVFWAQAVLDFSPFEGKFPTPKVPFITYPGQPSQSNPNDEDYKTELKEYQKKRQDWIFLESLRATPELEWETVNYDDPESWGNARQELLDSGFNLIEITLISNHVFTVNGVNPDQLEQAKQRFLAMRRQAEQNQSMQQIAQ